MVTRMEREGSMSDGGELLLLVVESAAAERANGMAVHPDRIAKTSDRVSRAWDAFRAFVGREQAGSGSAVEAGSSQSRGLTLGAVQPAPVSCACLVQGGDPWRCARAAHRTDRIACECSCHHNRVGSPAPVSGAEEIIEIDEQGRVVKSTVLREPEPEGPCVTPSHSPVSCIAMCPVRKAAQYFMDWAAEEITDGRLRQAFFVRFVQELTVVHFALAGPCIGPPAAPSEAGMVEPPL